MRLYFGSSLLVIFLSTRVAARFTLETCWGQECVLPTAAGVCYVPDGTTAITPCSGAGHADLATVFKAHLQQDLSIAYYNALDNTRLGGVEFNVPSDGTIIRLCLSGQAAGGDYWTFCEDAMGDNILSGSPVYCKLRQVPASVSDGCYTASRATGNTSATTTSLTTTSTSNWAVSEKSLREPFILHFYWLFVIYVFQ